MVMIDMDMPESCDDCPCYVQGYCTMSHRLVESKGMTPPPDWCELIDVGEGACEISQEGGES